MIKRHIAEKLRQLAGKFLVVTVSGPRQSGKTTLVRAEFPEHQYVNLENPEKRLLASTDPNGFLKSFSGNVIIDEIQYVPELLSYIQEIVDDTQRPGHFILTGSQSLLMLEKVSQSLAGRTALVNLLPLSYNELQNSDYADPNMNFEYYLFHGFFPGKYKMGIDPADFYPAYFGTYVQRDVRQIKNIVNLELFSNFVRLCAGRVGQVLELSSISGDAGVSVNTVKGWLSVLQAGHIIFLLRPYYKNLNKRLIKSPKLFFTDTGLAAFLLGITKQKQIESHYLRGGLFENLILLEMLKDRYNKGLPENIYYYRDNNKNEIDLIIDEGDKLKIIEIKSGQTFSTSFLKPLKFWERNFPDIPSETMLVYGGTVKQKIGTSRIIPWNGLDDIND